jgi:hypothetical protein
VKATIAGLNPGGVCTVDRINPRSVPPELIGKRLTRADFERLIENHKEGPKAQVVNDRRGAKWLYQTRLYQPKRNYVSGIEIRFRTVPLNIHGGKPGPTGTARAGRTRYTPSQHPEQFMIRVAEMRQIRGSHQAGCPIRPLIA